MPQSVMPKLLNPVILGGDCKLSDKGFTDIDILLNENDEQFF